MIFLFGERVRTRASPVGRHRCAVCRADQAFEEHVESLWFCLFAIPVLPIEKVARYWRCENCQSAYLPGQLEQPSAVPVLKKIAVYLLLGYNQQDHLEIASEICRKLTGFDFSDDEITDYRRGIAAGKVDMVEEVRGHAANTNGIGKQQIIEAAFLATYVCCDLEYEDRLRINLIGNALGVDLSFVDYAIEQARRQSYYGIRRLAHTERSV